MSHPARQEGSNSGGRHTWMEIGHPGCSSQFMTSSRRGCGGRLQILLTSEDQDKRAPKGKERRAAGSLADQGRRAAGSGQCGAVMRASKRDARGGRGDRESQLHRRRRGGAGGRGPLGAALQHRLRWTQRRANVAKMRSTRAPGGLAGGAGLCAVVLGSGAGGAGCVLLGAGAVVSSKSGASAGAGTAALVVRAEQASIVGAGDACGRC